MKVYYDESSRTVTIENINKYPASGSLIAAADGNNVYIKYVTNSKFEVYDNYTNYLKFDGSPAGASAALTIDYLNSQFNRGVLSGSDSFTLLGVSKIVTDSRILSVDTIIVQPSGLINEVLGVVVSNGSFEVTRGIANSLGVLTNNLAFKWVKI